MKILLALLLLQGTAQGAAKLIDISNGVAFPSNNSALFENTSVMTERQSSVELGVFTDGRRIPDTGTASLVSHVGALAFGLGVWKSDPTRDSLSLGLAYRVAQKLALGLGATFPLQDGGVVLDVGALFPVGESLTVGLAFYDVDPIPARWTIGFAAPFAGGKVIPELDFQFTNRGHSLEPATLDSLAGFSIVLQWLTVRVGYPFRAYPDYRFGRDFEAGLSVRFSQRFTAFAVANSHLGPRYFFGLKFQ